MSDNVGFVNMHEILYSIVILTYNRCNVLSELLSQITSLDNNLVEIVVVDNKSKDST